MVTKRARLISLVLSAALFLPVPLTPGDIQGRAPGNVEDPQPPRPRVRSVAIPGKESRFEARPDRWGAPRMKKISAGKVVVEMSNLPQGGLPGEPLLPHWDMRFLVPPDGDLGKVRVKLVSGTWRDLPGEYSIAPAPPQVTYKYDSREKIDKESVPAPVILPYDRSSYKKDRFFPLRPVEVLSVGEFRRWKLVEVRLWPVAYNPARKTVRYLADPAVSLTVPAQPGHAPVVKVSGAAAAADSEEFRAELLAGVDNPRDLPKFYQEPAMEHIPAKYVIITTNKIKANSRALASFICSKRAARFTVKVVTEGAAADETHYAAGYRPDSRANNIRAWLRSHWIADGISYVLLIGYPQGDPPLPYDPSITVPMKAAYNGPTDMFFAELSNTWDKNNNGKFGEAKGDYGPGGADKYCEVKVGRIPFYGVYQDLDNILRKCIDYAAADDGNLSWRSKVLIPAAVLNFAPLDENGDGDHHDTDEGDMPNKNWRTLGAEWGEAVKAVALDAGFTPYTLYEKTGCKGDGSAFSLITADAALGPTNVLNEWAKGYGFVDWWGHGSWQGAHRAIWTQDNTDPGICNAPTETSAPVFVNTPIIGPLNDATPAFVIQCSCTNGWPEDLDNLGYSLLKHGAIGALTATRNTTYCVGAWNKDVSLSAGDNASYGYLFLKRMAKFGSTAGAALNYCRLNLGMGWENKVIFNLYGDPSLSINSSKNPTITVTNPAAEDAYNIGSTLSFTWTSANISGPVKIQIDRNYPSHWETIIPSTDDDGSELWTVTGPEGYNCRFRIVSLNTPRAAYVSEGPVSIYSMVVTSPQGGESWGTCTTQTIRWESSNVPGAAVNILINSMTPGNWLPLFTNVPDTGSREWTVSVPAWTGYRIKIQNAFNNEYQAVSPGTFTVTAATVLSPNGGETWGFYSSYDIRWCTDGAFGTVSIELNRSYPSGPWEILFPSIANSGKVSWTVTEPASSACRIRVTRSFFPFRSDVSDGNFSISSTAHTHYQYTLAAGWNLISLPLVTETSPQLVFAKLPPGWVMSYYSPPDGRYLTGEEISLKPGEGYWLWMVEPFVYTIGGTLYLSGEAAIRLYPGWNMVGYPYFLPAAWGTARIRSGGRLLTLDEAAAEGVIVPGINWWDGSALINAKVTGTFQPGKGYQVTANTDCELVFFKP